MVRATVPARAKTAGIVFVTGMASPLRRLGIRLKELVNQRTRLLYCVRQTQTLGYPPNVAGTSPRADIKSKPRTSAPTPFDRNQSFRR